MNRISANTGHLEMEPGRRRILRLAAFLLPATALAACSNIIPGQGEPPNLYRLTPKSTFPEAMPTVEWQMVLAQPEADAALDTTRIALMRDATQVEYYARSSWTDRAPSMVQTLILESFENSKKIVAVGRRAVGLRADFELRTELREFQAEYLASGIEAHVAINAKLIRASERAIVGQQNFVARAPAAADQVAAVVQAFDTALGTVLKQLVAWTLETGNANHRPAR